MPLHHQVHQGSNIFASPTLGGKNGKAGLATGMGMGFCVGGAGCGCGCCCSWNSLSVSANSCLVHGGGLLDTQIGSGLLQHAAPSDDAVMHSVRLLLQLVHCRSEYFSQPDHAWGMRVAEEVYVPEQPAVGMIYEQEACILQQGLSEKPVKLKLSLQLLFRLSQRPVLNAVDLCLQPVQAVKDPLADGLPDLLRA